jgi:UDP-N-acetylmuramate dehydrogenase
MAGWRRTIETSINRKVSKIFWDEPLSSHTTFRIGGKAECVIIINDLEDLKKIIVISKREEIPIFTIGQGSNLLISDQGIKGIIIKLGKGFSYISKNNNEIRIGSATPLSHIIKFGLEQSLSGIEFLWGVPGAFGGAIASNAGAFSQNIGDIISKIYGISTSGELKSLTQEQLNFEYRKTNLPIGFIIIDGLIRLFPTSRTEIKQKLNQYQNRREITQPWGASAGSIFKNPNTTPAGKLIDDCKLKGLLYNDAYISKKHGNFIINRCSAHFIDVYEIIQLIKSTVETKKNIILEEEIQILPKAQEVKKWQNQKKY